MARDTTTARHPYRIEAIGAPARTAGSGGGDERHREVMEALASLQRLLTPSQQISQAVVDEHRRDLTELHRIKAELDAISSSIRRTKEEIATLHYAGAQGHQITRVTDELGAVVEGTAGATNTILEAAERVDELAGNLSSRLVGADGDMAIEIADNVVRIFEACNFQDITGQRIGKVVGALRFIEERVGHMIEIWGGLETFKNIPVQPDDSRRGERALINGPPLAGDDCQSQDDVDALFD
ncbi:MAG TPA: hypothetical protein VIL09_04015 [Microvirga sp.]